MSWILIQDKPRSLMKLDDIGRNAIQALEKAEFVWQSPPPHPPNDTFYGDFKDVELIACVNDDDVELLLKKIKEYQKLNRK